jgi:hypothetical protein
MLYRDVGRKEDETIVINPNFDRYLYGICNQNLAWVIGMYGEITRIDTNL